MKSPFKGFQIAVSGDFGEQRSPAAVSRWIENNGGVVAKKIDDYTTHLICSLKDFTNAKQIPKVRDALKRKAIHIVTFDWLEDSLHSGRLKTEKKYLLSNVVKAQRKEKKAVIREAAKFAKGCVDTEADMLSKNHHVYCDKTFFFYNITLTRADIRTNKNERHELKIYESNSVPHLYAAYTRYIRAGRSATQMLAPVGSFFETAHKAFRDFFRARTGRAWEDRLVPEAPKEDVFLYAAPGPGKPRGMMPPGWVDPEEGGKGK
ncbi:MAG: hypothetical protein M1829_001176 [Trizodia sp. TS-e1964]|nr:MAG: hypothetical protein M1829_001176 [Trizodia sp. TS-e1964]